MGSTRHQTFGNIVDGFQSRGRYTFSFAEMSMAFGGSATALRSAIRRLKEKGRLVSPCREFYVIVPVEYRSLGSPPASWFVDDLMRFAGKLYYVGLLSAAAVYGAAHQQPQQFQVVTEMPTRPMMTGRVRIAFVRKRDIRHVATQQVKTETGYMTVSTPEVTVFDLVRHARLCGHLNNVATVLSELAGSIDFARLQDAAARATVPEVQRAGYLLELVGEEAPAERIAEHLRHRRVRPVLLRPGASADGKPLDERWRLIINENVEPDL